ncbi:MAG: RNA polymerase sigma factor [Oscillospiraceae bacterium]|nr:RNA polymerase sigma factor [Oscillospiraceae bacterium]
MDKETFIKAVLEAETTLYHVSKTIIRSDTDCEDAVQEAVIKAYTNLHKLRNDKYFKTWLIRIVINECYRMQKNKTEHLSYDEYSDIESPDVTDYSDLYEAIMKLNVPVKLAVVLHYIEGYSLKEIGDILKIPVGTVKSRLAKGRNMLKSILNENEVNKNE